MLLLWAVVAFPEIRDYDYGFHLAIGRWIVEHLAVPRVDLFSYSAAGSRYVDAHWLFQVALYGLTRIAGHPGARMAAGVCVLAMLAIVAHRSARRRVLPWGALAAALLLVATAPRILVRPEIVSFVLLTLVLSLLQRHDERGGRAVLAVVPLQLLWSNVHGLFAVGLAAIALALAAEGLRPLLQRGAARRPAHVRRLGSVLVLSALAALVNPNGVDGALQPLEQLGMIGPAGVRGVFGIAIAELQPTLSAGAAGLGSFPLAAAALLAGLAGLALARDRDGASGFDGLVLLAFAPLALAAQRNVPLFAIAAALVLVRHAAGATSRPGAGRLAFRALAIVSILVVASTGLAMIAGHLRLLGGPRVASSSAFANFHFPERAVDWIERERPPGPLYHRLGDGGYLMWRLGPDVPVLIDGRLEVYGARRYAETELIGDDPPAGFRRLDARYRFGSALITYSLFPDLSLLAWLHAQPDWRLTYVDEVAAVFVRVAPGEPPRWPEADPLASDGLPALDPAHAGHAIDLWRRRTRVWVWASLGHPREALALARETLAIRHDQRLEDLLPWLEARAR